MLKSNSKRPNDNIIIAMIFILTSSIFALDLLMPIGVAVGSFYGIAVLSTLWCKRLADTYWVSITAVCFSIMGLLVSSVLSSEVIINTVLALVIIICSGFLVLKHKTAKEKITTLNILSTTDSLTLVKNRIAFNEIIPIEILRAKRYNRSLSLALIDIDHFDQVNEKYGRDFGDKCLKQLVAEIKTMVRHSDCIYRLSGDEFAIVFVETDMIQVVAVVEDICKRISMLAMTDKNIINTISVGVDTCESTDTIETLVARTNEALKQSKDLDGNCVTTIHELGTADFIRVG